MLKRYLSFFTASPEHEDGDEDGESDIIFISDEEYDESIESDIIVISDSEDEQEEVEEEEQVEEEAEEEVEEVAEEHGHSVPLYSVQLKRDNSVMYTMWALFHMPAMY